MKLNEAITTDSIPHEITHNFTIDFDNKVVKFTNRLDQPVTLDFKNSNGQAQIRTAWVSITRMMREKQGGELSLIVDGRIYRLAYLQAFGFTILQKTLFDDGDILLKIGVRPITPFHIKFAIQDGSKSWPEVFKRIKMSYEDRRKWTR
jgi:hypothetical protein